jgi:hypothetical protein
MDLTSAREAFNEGMDLREKGEVKAALPKLEAAYAYAKTPITGLELGRTYMMVGRLVDAYETLLAVTRMQQAFEETARSRAAREEAPKLVAEIEPRIAAVRVVLTLPPEATATVRIDGKPIPRAALATARLVDPGKHEIVARAGDGPEARTTVDLAEGEKREVTLSPKWVPPKEPSNTVTIRSTNPLVYIGLASAAGFLATAGTLYGVADSKASDVRRQCQNLYCPGELAQQADVARGIGTAAVVMFLAAAAAGSVAIFGFIHPATQTVPAPQQPANASLTPSFGLGPAGIEGRF